MESSLKYQQELVKKYEQENNESFRKLTSLMREDCFIVSKGELSGPYLTYTTYYMSNGENITIKTPSSLNWNTVLNYE